MAISRVQGVGNNLGLNSFTVGLSPTTPGNAIVVAFDIENHIGADLSVTITDNDGGGGGNTYTRITASKGQSNDSGDFSQSEIWYAQNIIGGGSSVTLTITINGGTGTINNCFYFVAEYSGLATSGVLDDAGATSQDGSGPPFTTASVSATGTSDLVLTVCGSGNGWPTSVNSPFTVVTAAGYGSFRPFATLITSGPGSYSATYPTGFSHSSTSIAAFTAPSATNTKGSAFLVI